MNLSKSYTWVSNGKTHTFRVAQGIGTHIAPDGTVNDMTIAEWRDFARVLREAIGDVPLPKSQSAALPNVGARWTRESDDALSALWSEGVTVTNIARRLGRTRGGITARLVHLGLADDRNTTSGRSTIGYRSPGKASIGFEGER